MAAKMGEEVIDVLVDDGRGATASGPAAGHQSSPARPYPRGRDGRDQGFQNAVTSPSPGGWRPRISTVTGSWRSGTPLSHFWSLRKARPTCSVRGKRPMRWARGLPSEESSSGRTRRRSETPTVATGKSRASMTEAGTRDVVRQRVQTRTARAARPRSGSLAAMDAEATTGGQSATRWAPSARNSGVPAVARRDASRNFARRRRRRGQRSFGTTANHGSSSRTCRKTTKGSGTETPALRTEGRETTTATVTVTADTEDAAGRRHTPEESDLGAAHAVGAETEVETGAATRAETGVGTRVEAAARNQAGAAAAKRAESKGRDKRRHRSKSNSRDRRSATGDNEA